MKRTCHRCGSELRLPNKWILIVRCNKCNRQFYLTSDPLCDPLRDIWLTLDLDSLGDLGKGVKYSENAEIIPITEEIYKFIDTHPELGDEVDGHHLMPWQRELMEREISRSKKKKSK